MRNKKTILNYSGFSLSLLFILLLFLYTVNPTSAEIQDNNPFGKMQVQIPGLEDMAADPAYKATCDNDGLCHIPWLSVYIASIYKYLIGSVGIIATAAIVWGGVLWVTAAGNTSRVESAKTTISAALTGMVLALASYFVLYQINPDLTVLKPITMKNIQKTESSQATASAISRRCRWGGDCKEYGEEFELEIDKTLCASFSSAGLPNCCCTTIVPAGNISSCNVLIYSQAKRNTSETDTNGVKTCYYDCSSYVNAYLTQQGLSPVGNTTADMLRNPRAVNYTAGMSLDINDVIVYPASGSTEAHTVICSNANCTQVYNMSGSQSGLKTSSPSWFLGQAGVKIIKQ